HADALLEARERRAVRLDRLGEPLLELVDRAIAARDLALEAFGGGGEALREVRGLTLHGVALALGRGARGGRGRELAGARFDGGPELAERALELLALGAQLRREPLALTERRAQLDVLAPVLLDLA